MSLILFNLISHLHKNDIFFWELGVSYSAPPTLLRIRVNYVVNKKVAKPLMVGCTSQNQIALPKAGL